jgi:hypothetical protein
MKQFAVAVMFITSLAGVSSAFAGQSAILAANNQVGVQLISTNVDYTETGNGVFGSPTGTLDTETGRVPGFALSISTMQDLWLGNDYLEAEYAHSHGNTDYIGGYISPPTPYGSVTGTSTAVLEDYSARYGAGIVISDNLMLTPYGELGHHEWDRGVNQGEIYTHDYYGFGLLAQYSPASKLVFSANALIGSTFAANIIVNGVFSGPLGNSTLTRFGVAADYALAQNLHANVGVDYTSFSYGISGFYPVGTTSVAWEPDSKTNYTIARVGLGYAF